MRPLKLASVYRLLLLFSLVGFAGASSADTIGLRNCDAGGCQESTLFMQMIDQGGSFAVSLTPDADAYTGNRSGRHRVGFLGVRGWTSAWLNWYTGAQYPYGPRRPRGRIISNSDPIPEPSGAVAFGAGLLVFSQVVRRKQ